MITTKTVFIVGAGASCEFKLPLAPELAEWIGKALDFNGRPPVIPERDLVEAGLAALSKRRDAGANFSALLAKAAEVSSRLVTTKSIDALVDNHSHDPQFALVAKAAIAACLIRAERFSKLRMEHPGDTIDLRRASPTWIAHLFDILANRVPAADPEAIFQNVSFVVFNYDRCIQQYFRYALVNRFGVTPSKANQMVEELRIVHPYGSLGSLNGNTWFGCRLDPSSYPGGEVIATMTDSLLTFSESKRAAAKEARALIAEAERAIFLGFAFHPQNVELLTQTAMVPLKSARATAYLMSPTDCEETVQEIGKICNGIAATQECLKNVKCADFILNERRYLER